MKKILASLILSSTAICFGDSMSVIPIVPTIDTNAIYSEISATTNRPSIFNPTIIEPSIWSDLKNLHFIGASDFGNDTYNSRGLITYGTLANQRLMAPLFWGDSNGKGPAQPEVSRQFVKGVPTWVVASAFFSAVSIEMTNYLGIGLSQDLTHWNVKRFQPISVDSATWVSLTNYYWSLSPSSIAVSRTSFEFGEPTFFHDRKTGTNWLGFSFCYTQSQQEQTIWAVPFLDDTFTNFGTAIMLKGLEGSSGRTAWDPHIFYDMQGRLTMEVVKDSTYVAHYTNSDGYMSTNFVLKNASALGTLQTLTGTNVAWYVERPQTLVFGTNYYALVGMMTPRTNSMTVDIGVGRTCISVSTNLVNWSTPFQVSTVATNNYGQLYSALGKAIVPNGLKLFLTDETPDPLSASEMTWMTVTNAVGAVGVAYIPSFSLNPAIPPYPCTNLDWVGTNGFVFWPFGEFDSPTNVTTESRSAHFVAANPSTALNATVAQDFYVASTNLARVEAQNEDANNKNGDMWFYTMQNGVLTKRGGFLSDGTMVVGTSALNYGYGIYAVGIVRATGRLQTDLYLYLGGNAGAPPIVPSGTDGYFYNSNRVVFWITSTKTNLINDGR